MKKPRTAARGYGGHHVALRKLWKRDVEAGSVLCWRCGRLIRPGDPWDLGHDDQDRTKYKGPEHTRCNRGAPRRDPTPVEDLVKP